jgi:hypothetical protein
MIDIDKVTEACKRINELYELEGDRGPNSIRREMICSELSSLSAYIETEFLSALNPMVSVSVKPRAVNTEWRK